MFEVLFTKDGILNPFPIEPVVVCHPPKIWLVHLFFFFTCNEIYSIFSVKEGETRMKL